MPARELQAKDVKLIQYLNEAYGKEKELETSLEAHISMTTRTPYKKRLQQHLRETKGHARKLEQRIRQIGGSDAIAETTSTVQSAVAQAAAVAKGPLHVIRGTGEQEKMLKNAKTEFWNEHEEIATYNAIETLAESVGDRETAKVARGIRREEERMAGFLERQAGPVERRHAHAPPGHARHGLAPARLNAAGRYARPRAVQARAVRTKGASGSASRQRSRRRAWRSGSRAAT